MWEVDGGEPLAASYEMYSYLVEGSWGLGATRYDRHLGFGGVALDQVRKLQRLGSERFGDDFSSSGSFLGGGSEVIQNWFAVLARKLAVSADQLSLSEDLSNITALVQESQAVASQEQKWLVQARNGERFEAVEIGRASCRERV